MTCNDCLHFKICKDWRNSIDSMGFIVDEIEGGNICEDFKNKGRYVELNTSAALAPTILERIELITKARIQGAEEIANKFKEHCTSAELNEYIDSLVEELKMEFE